MWLSDISVKRPVLASVISILLIAFGVLSFLRLSLREYPDINPPIVSVMTTYRGASADTIETKITQVVEDSISGIEGIRSIQSESQDGLSTITVEFKLRVEINEAANDVRDRVNRIAGDLPDDADPPEISKKDANTDAIIWLGLTSDSRDMLELTDYADRNLKDRFSVLDGVAQVIIGGEKKYAMRVWLDKQRLAAHGLTVTEVSQALRAENVELPAGRLESVDRDMTLRIARPYATPEEFRGLVVGRGAGDSLIRLGDVATIEIGAESDRRDLSGTGKNIIGLGITRQSKGNTLEVARLVKKELAEAQAGLPKDLKLELYWDASVFIDASIKEVVRTLVLAIGLVILVIFFFLGDLRAVLIPAITIPISIVSAFIVLYGLGFSVNLLTLLGLVLAIGLVVDDSIVVLENIYSRIEKGEPPLLAAYRGAREVGFAVIATTLVLVAVFVPITFMSGNTGRLFSEFALTIAGAVCFSSVVALTLTPALASKLLKRRDKPSLIKRTVDKVMGANERFYEKVLHGVAKVKWLVLVAFVALMACTFWVFPQIKSEFAPEEDRGVVFTILIAPEGASFPYVQRNMREVEKNMMSLVERGEATRSVTFFPLSESLDGDVNMGIAIVMLEDWEKRERGAKEIMGELFFGYSQIPGAFAFPMLPPSLGQDFSAQQVQFVIAGSSYDELAQWRDKIMARAYQYPGLNSLDSDYKATKPKMVVEVDKNRAATLGVSLAEIGNTLQAMLGSIPVTTYLDRGEEYDVILQNAPEDRNSPDDLNGIYVRSTTSGSLIPLSNLVHLEEEAGPSKLNRLNRSRAITLTANVSPGYSLGEALAFLETVATEELPQTALIDYKGPSREFKESSSSLVFVFGLAILIVFLVLAAQFESWISPFVIMLTVPLAVLGALLGLWIFGQTMNTYSQIGLIMLIGLATKNGILIVEFANQLRDQGVEFTEALFQSAKKRFRPILMTALSTAIGALPLLLASGAGAESRIAIGTVVFWGVLFATFFTSFFIPIFYLLLAKKQKSPGALAQQLEKYEDDYS